MKLTLQVMVTADCGQEEMPAITEIERKDLHLDTGGLTLAEDKAILKWGNSTATRPARLPHS